MTQTKKPRHISEARRKQKLAYKAAWRKANPEKERAYYTAYRAANLEAVRANSRRHNWGLQGIDPAEAAARLAEHNGRCDVCGTDKHGGRGRWHIDHDHVTKKIRGILCAACNLALGRIDRVGLRAFSNYLAKE